MTSHSRSVLLLACLTATALAQQTKAPPAPDTLEEAVVSGQEERLRKHRTHAAGLNPDRITVTRNGATRVELFSVNKQQEIHFSRESAARLATGEKRLRNVTFELAPDISEADGLPALIPFGPHTSLVNVDYVHLRNTSRPTIITVRNVINPNTRSCQSQVGFSNDGQEYPNRFVLLGDKLGDCALVVRNREGDLFFADAVPERLRQEMQELYTPIYNRFARKLGSEPGITFVLWRPDFPRSYFDFERNWGRSSLLVFNGPAWQQGFVPEQREALWATMAAEQIMRRLGWEEQPDAFTDSAVNYLLVLAKAERDHATVQGLTAELPGWIARCARDLKAAVHREASTAGVPGYDCGLVLQFVYDAVARANSRGKDTVYDTWRGLLDASFGRGDSGVAPEAFMASSGEARRIVQVLLDGSVDWPLFVAELDKLEVRLQINASRPELAIGVQSLAQFHD